MKLYYEMGEDVRGAFRGSAPAYRAKVIQPAFLRRRTITRPVLVPLPGKEEWDYVLLHDYTFSAPIGAWTIDAGYQYDGASVPSIVGFAWKLTYSKHDNRVMRAALVHDFLCDEKPGSFDYKAAAELFYQMLLEDGCSPFKAGLMRRAVLLGGPRW